MGHEQGQTCQSLFQILPQDFHSLRRIHLLVLLILILNKDIQQEAVRYL